MNVSVRMQTFRHFSTKAKACPCILIGSFSFSDTMKVGL